MDNDPRLCQMMTNNSFVGASSPFLAMTLILTIIAESCILVVNTRWRKKVQQLLEQ
jgi:hypothetical protein